MNARFWKDIQNKGKVTLDSFREFCLRQQLFAFKEFCMKLSNISETTNVKLAKAILKSSYRVL